MTRSRAKYIALPAQGMRLRLVFGVQGAWALGAAVCARNCLQRCVGKQQRCCSCSACGHDPICHPIHACCMEPHLLYTSLSSVKDNLVVATQYTRYY